MKKYQITILLLIITVFKVSGQNDLKKGQIITLANDTIFGWINVKSNLNNSKTCEFMANGQTEMLTYTPNDLKSYQFESNKYYVSKPIAVNGKEYNAFLEFLVAGVVNLYYYRLDDKEYYFIEKDNKMNILTDDERIVIDEFGTKSIKKTKRYIGTLLYLFKDAEGISKSINNTDLSYESLIDITEKYHNAVCSDYECIVYKKSTQLKITFEPLISYGLSIQGLKEYTGTCFDMMPIIGLNLRFQPARIHYLWSFSFGLSYSMNTFEGVYKFEPTYGKTYVDSIDVSYSIIRVPILVQYTFPEKQLTPFLFSGFNISNLFNYTYQIDRYTKLPHGDVPTYDIVSETPSIQLGMVFGGGMLFKLNDNTNLMVSTNYEFRANATNFGYILENTNYHSFMLNLGISYELK